MNFKNICEKCTIKYKGEVIERVGILKVYSDFLISSMEKNNNQVSLTLHTNSLCFDILLLVYSVLYCVYIDNTTVKDIIDTLNIGDQILYGKTRAIYKGINEKGYVIISTEKQDHGLICSHTNILSPKSFNKIRPYKGTSKRLDGRGIRLSSTERNKFIKQIFNKSDEDIPPIIQKSLIVLLQKSLADSFMRDIVIWYNDGKSKIEINKLITASYYTESDEYRYFGNVEKNEPVIKFMSKSSLARENIISDENRNIIGVIVLDKDIYKNGKTELINILTRKSVLIKHICFPYEFDDTKALSDDFNCVNLFACTAQLMEVHNFLPVGNGDLMKELRQKSEVILNKMITTLIIDKTYDQDFFDLKKDIHFLKNYCETDVEIEKFIIYSYSLTNLFSTAIFPLKIMEDMIKQKSILCQSPKSMMIILEEVSNNFSGIMGEKMLNICRILKKLYNLNYSTNAKCENLILRFKYFQYQDTKKAIIVPKEFYKIIFEEIIWQRTKRKFSCYISTANKFESKSIFEEIIVISSLYGKRFDVFRNLSSLKITLLQYGFEILQFNSRYNSYIRLVDYYNSLLSKELLKEYQKGHLLESDGDDIKIDLSLQEFVNNIAIGNILNSVSIVNNEGDIYTQAEIIKIAKCVNGETIFFTKYCTPYVVDMETFEIVEKDITEIISGDILIFNKINNESRDIVDNILHDLVKLDNDISKELAEQYSLANYWKKTLKEYMIYNNLSYKDISDRMKENGIVKHEVTLRAWLNTESHIVGPRDIDSYYQIGILCKDRDMIDYPEKYCDSCNHIRSIRVKILKSLSEAVIKSYINPNKEKNEFYDYIASRIDEISETVEVENIIDIDGFKVPAYMSNKPQYI